MEENTMVEIKDIIDENGMIVDKDKIKRINKDASFMIGLAQNLAPACMEQTKNGFYYVSKTAQEVIEEIGTVLCTTNLAFNGLNDLEKYDILMKNYLVDYVDYKFSDYLDMAIEDILNKQEAEILEHKAELMGQAGAVLGLLDVLGKHIEASDATLQMAKNLENMK